MATDTSQTAFGAGASRGATGFFLAVLIVAPVAAIYFLLPLQNYTDAKDSVSYAFNILHGAPYFHPNHLMYEPLNFAINRAASQIFGPVDPLRSMQLVSTVSAVLTLFLICRIAQRWGDGAWHGGVAVAAIGFSFGVWCYSISADGYLPPLMFVMITMALLDPARWARNGALSPSMGIVVAAALSAAMGVLLHQMYVFFTIAIAVMMLLGPEFGSVYERFRRFVVFGAISGSIVVAVYIAVYLKAVSHEQLFFDWVRGYASKGLYYANPPSLLTPFLGAMGAVTSMLSMNAVVAFDAVANAAQQWFPGQIILEERFIAETAIGRPMAAFIFIAMVISILAWVALAGMAITASLAARRRIARRPFVDRLLLVLVVIYALLVLIWEPVNREFWIHVYVFATLLCAMCIDLRRVSGKAIAIVLCCSLFLANYLAAIRPLSTQESDYWRVFHREAFANVPTKDYDVVLMSCSYLCVLYERYFHVSSVVVPDVEAPQRYIAELEKYPPGRILVSKWFLVPHTSYMDLKTRRPVGQAEYDEVLKAFSNKFLNSGLPGDGLAEFYRIDGGRLVPVGQ